MKRAVVFIIDASPSMDASFDGSTRLEAAKQAVKAMVGDLMLQSKTNQVAVVVLGTPETIHHQATGEQDDPFPNITQIPESGLAEASPAVLRAVHGIQTHTDGQGDWMDGLCLAADAMYARTHKKKFERRIVLLTDAEQPIVMDVRQASAVLTILREEQCPLDIIGLGFEDDDDRKESPTKRVKREDVDDDNTRYYEDKDDRIKLLEGLAAKTGGLVMPASDLQQILAADKGKRVKKAVKYKVELEIAPKISLDCRYMLLMGKETTLKMEHFAVSSTAENHSAKDGMIEDQLEETEVLRNFVDPDVPDRLIEREHTTDAIAYGSTLIPMNAYDMEFLRDFNFDKPKIQILGYLPCSQVPRVYRMGPPYVLSGAESHRSCTAIAALAQSLKRADKVAICTFTKRKHSDPVLGGLFPCDQEIPRQLVFLQLPFANETKQLKDTAAKDLQTAEDDDAKQKAADALVESLSLPSGCLASGSVPNPFQRSVNQTLLNRAIDPDAPLVNFRAGHPDLMATPNLVLERASSAIDVFSRVFNFCVKDPSRVDGDEAKCKLNPDTSA